MAANRPSILSATSHANYFPHWMAGPLGGLLPGLTRNTTTLKYLFSRRDRRDVRQLRASALAYVPRLRARWAIATVVAVHAIFLLAPPLALTDIFNYVNYGRMEVVHHLNPYTTIPILEPHNDPSYDLSNWHQLLSPYGPLFTLLTFVVVPLGVAASFWVLKGCSRSPASRTLLLVWKCARLLGRDPVAAIVLVGLNPIVLVWGLGGDHNDFLMVFFIVLGFYLLLRAREATRARDTGGAVRSRGRAADGGGPRRSRNRRRCVRACASWLLPLSRAGDRRRRGVRHGGRDQGVGRRADPGRARRPLARAAAAGAGARSGWPCAAAVIAGREPDRLRPAHPRPEHAEPAGDERQRAQPDRPRARRRAARPTSLHMLLSAVLLVSVALCCVQAWRRRAADHRLGLGERRAARDAQLGAAVVRAVGAADGRAVELAPAARDGARARRVPDHRLGARLRAAVERDRLSPGENLARAPAPALRQGAA